MAKRVLDPEALRKYRNITQAQLDFVEDVLIPKLRTGEVLGNEPGFGLLDSSEAARESYKVYHKQTWDNLQDLRKNLTGIIKTLNDSADLSEEAEEINVDETSSYENDL
ncbi:hypothetical protein [Glycomyces sp. NRRL B-16210]|uniref:hypothetical protein n=1 Tax=Glycomyces sp. NRRL B-16210 TaxID=1463821 RepID=UPI0004C022CE|nr:hypothetical protein [Glycomyces sp. NRRL B-16210]